ncbi:MAG: CocE/NonD family hydrolase [Proteobacteria bacterium]|nr:CocE/NonD family hydrolase [Pseudomonadota bacterium]
MREALLPLFLSTLLAVPASAQIQSDLTDIPAKVVKNTAANDYERRVVMIPMRDGVKLHTVLVIPKGAHDAPILLTRTPYNAAKRAQAEDSPYRAVTLPKGDQLFTDDGYIRVFQDTRGKYGSEGDFVITRPVRGPLNPTKTDETTDAWDTIDWLVKNIKESNGRVGMVGSSYEGFTVVMALLDPHPALKVTAPESPMIDGWMGDDWFHYGAYRQNSLDFITAETSARGEGNDIPRAIYDDYESFLRAGSVDGWAKAHGLEQYPYYQRTLKHPAYDAFWQGQALDKLLVQHPSQVPTMWEQGLFDQEDMWGAVHSFQALRNAGHGANNFLVIGPWRHSGANYDGTVLGDLKFEGDTALQWRRDILKPFFDHYLKDKAAPVTPKAMIYNVGANRWDRFDDWPLSCEANCSNPLTPLFLGANGGLSFNKPAAGSDSYISDPAKPIPYIPRPIRFSDTPRWQSWLTTDQRPYENRPDVLTYVTDALTSEVRISGIPSVDLFAATTGTDSDWVVKLIDVYPDMNAARQDMSGYELPIAMDIFRGRYRESFEHPSAIPANTAQRYHFTLPPTNHVFLPGHRIMVQIQSSWFPLYDRNPQTYVDNIFLAKPQDYKAATQSVFHGGTEASAILLPVVSAK